MTIFGQDTKYWRQKIIYFLHDPPDKALKLQGHEERSGQLLNILGLQDAALRHETYGLADRIASGMDRATLPGFRDNGFVDFLKDPVLTHPTGSNPSLKINLPSYLDPNKVFSELMELVKNDIGISADSETKGYSDMFRGQEAEFSPARFHYLHFVLRRRLALKNIGGLGGLWYRLPADTRIPDHSIWQHSSLVSAIGSCFDLSSDNKASLVVFSITPVQEFISRARKLRDYWTGSVLLSWLAFEGIKTVILQYGADHVLYPSLHGQPLVDDWLAAEDGLHMGKLLDRVNAAARDDAGVASFPNKFVFLVPKGKENEICSKITRHVKARWHELGEKSLEIVEQHADCDDYLRQQFLRRQIDTYWEFHWAASPLVQAGDADELSFLLHGDAYQQALTLYRDSNNIFKNTDSRGYLYPVTHSLAQAALAAGKSWRTEQRIPEPGIKCDLLGEYEALRLKWQDADYNPPPSRDPFWRSLRDGWPNKVDFKTTERLCALALVKRIAYRVCEEWQGHPLQRLFKRVDRFPSSTEIALHDYFEEVKREKGIEGYLVDLDETKAGQWKKKLAEHFRANIDDTTTSKSGEAEINDNSQKDQLLCREVLRKCRPQQTDSYYAILIMDGDRMGKLVNGETIAASWGSALHPDLAGRLTSGVVPEEFKNFWRMRLKGKRHLSPAGHAAISEALGDFALITVPKIIHKYGGRLIYAGGDDVCAVLPVSTALDAARDIATAYGLGFVSATADDCSEVVNTWTPMSQKLMLHLGIGKDLTISAGVLICHHKRPLRAAVQRTHQLLEMAKDQADRNALALEVDKRAGGSRLFLTKWDTPAPLVEGEHGLLLDSFLQISSALASDRAGGQLSSSLAYRLQQFDDGLRALVRNNSEHLPAFISAQLGRSGKRDKTVSDRPDPLAFAISSMLVYALNNVFQKEKPLDPILAAKTIGKARERHEIALQGRDES
jgi:CRISPR-associated protein Cmr2